MVEINCFKYYILEGAAPLGGVRRSVVDYVNVIGKRAAHVSERRTLLV